MKALKEFIKAARAESERWFIVCCTCGTGRSIAELGGVRYKAHSVGKRALIRCPSCKRLRVAKFEYRTSIEKSSK